MKRSITRQTHCENPLAGYSEDGEPVVPTSVDSRPASERLCEVVPFACPLRPFAEPEEEGRELMPGVPR